MLDEVFSKSYFDNNNNNTEDDDDMVFYQEDETLVLATKECMKTGTFLPLLKEELKCKILAKCHQEGKELKVEQGKKFTPQKKTLLPDEEKKLEKRREQNRRAAKKFRERKRSETDKLEQTTSDLEGINEELRQEIRRLSKERNDLMALLSSHFCTIPHDPVTLDTS